MTEFDALVAAVRECPAEDTPRLVLADWLDENGRPEWAELIRLQCQWSQMQSRMDEYRSGSERVTIPRSHEHCQEWKNLRDESYPIRDRIKALLDDPYVRDSRLPRWFTVGPGRGHAHDTLPEPGRVVFSQGGSVVFRRGFVSELHLTMQDYMDLINSPAGVRDVFRWPVETVLFTDKGPEEYHPPPDTGYPWNWSWYAMGLPDDPSTVPASFPHELFAMIPTHNCVLSGGGRKAFPSRDAAIAALSDAAVRLARQRCEFPETVPA